MTAVNNAWSDATRAITDLDVIEAESVRHEPMLCSTWRYGAWCCCSCGWISRTYTTSGGAHIAFGQHLLDCR